MTILPLDPAANANPAALRAFLEGCREMAREKKRAQIVSITVRVGALDPLAVLESIFEPTEPHFYAERPDLQTAVAGAEVVVEKEGGGAGRFRELQAWAEEMLANTIAVGEVEAPFGGPHFFTTFGFLDRTETDEPFPAARIFMPRWQVARAGESTTAVANLLVDPAGDLDRLAERVWRAHARFRSFDFAPAVAGERSAPVRGAMDSARGGPADGFRIGEAGDYLAAVRRALARIEGGDFQKIVLARALDLEAAEPLHPLELLNGLRQKFPSCYAFSVANGRGQSFIGATPERLVRVSRGRLQTEALAGSARRGAGASEDAALGARLLGSEKDRREHRLVLDDIAVRLKRLGLSPSHSAEPVLRRLANVQHLHSAIEAPMPADRALLEVVSALHATPAVGGWPPEKAIPCIRDLEGFPRGLYGGTLGWMNARGGGEFFVGLRSALVEGRRARLYAGAGIVAGSTPEKEFAETELKFEALLAAFRG